LTPSRAPVKHGSVNATPPPIRYEPIAPRAPEGPFSLSALLPGEGPLELDVGFGRGMSLFERARVAPDSRIVGVEIKNKWAFKVAERVAKRGLGDKMLVLAGDVKEILARVTPGPCLSRAFVHFPDPWWKRRHNHRVVVGTVFLDEVGRLMLPGGDLYVQTDVEERAREYLDAIDEHPLFERATPGDFVDENPFGARSNREVRAEEDGLPVYRILARRSA
jgi:tRNA (guanine-N7-)-methyltransferase